MSRPSFKLSDLYDVAFTGKWIICFELPKQKGHKTSIYEVWSQEQQCGLGEVRWFGRWRKFCFFPAMHTVWEQDCLRDIAQFLDHLTEQRKK